MKEKIGTQDEFHSKTCYKLYMYAVKLAKQVNEYIDKGYDCSSHKFIFYNKDEPCVAEKTDNGLMIWCGSSFDDNGKVWLHGDVTKKKITQDFKEIKIYKPENCIKLNYG